MHPEIYQKAENAFESAINYLKNEKQQSETLSNSYRNLGNAQPSKTTI